MKRFIIFICALFVFGTCHATTLNFQQPNGTTKQIELDTNKSTTPALAMRVGDTIYYANLIETTNCASGDACVSYGNKTYTVRDNSKYKVTITTTEMLAGDIFAFNIAAKGYFIVDWGDGKVDEIVRNDTEWTDYSHTYIDAGVHTIKIGGVATAYSLDTSWASIGFWGNKNIIGISGSLGAICPTIGDGTTIDSQPSFYEAFYDCTELTEISENLFSGVSGAATDMFALTFYGCTGLKGNSAKIGDKYLYEIYDDSVGPGCYYGATGLSDYDNIPDKWK